MTVEMRFRLTGRIRTLWEGLLSRAGLTPEESPEQTVLVWQEERLAATGSRQGNLLKYIAVDPDFRGEDLTATVLSRLRAEAFTLGHRHLFLYTKPENRFQFQSLFFYPVVQTDRVLLMEDKKDGIRTFLQNLPSTDTQGEVGGLVMNCDPFTLGHRYLIETAARECGHVYVFVLSEDRSRFSPGDRIAMVRAGTADLDNVTVLPTGPYLISAATFPTYFLKDREQAPQVHCGLDIAVFSQYFAPHFGITRRYVGSEPLSPMTGSYNRALRDTLPRKGIEVREIPRLENKQGPVSASAVRALWESGEDFRALVPDTTYQYLTQGGNHHG